MRRLTAAILALAALMAPLASALVSPATAAADGDPASDVLLSQNLFLPRELSYSAAVTRLDRELAAADAAGFPIKVALIDTSADLGTVNALWEKPGPYATYLWKELSLDYDGQLLVVMPGGYGLHGPASGPHAVTAREWKVEAPGTGTGEHMVDAALVAVQRLVAAVGRSLPAGNSRTIALRGGSGSGGGSAGTWIALVAGLAIVAAAWGASLRARPPRLRHRVPT